MFYAVLLVEMERNLVDDLEQPNSSHKGKTLRNYTASFKLKVIEHSERSSKSSAARLFNVDRRMVIRWVTNRQEIQKQTTEKCGKEKKRLSGGGRKAAHEDLESLLYEWIMERRLKGLRVSRILIRKKALLLFKEMEDPRETDFSSSKGWCEKFMKRKGLSLRRRTSVCQKDPNMLFGKLVAYILRVRRLRVQHNYPLQNIFAMDETPIWSDMVSTSTVDKVGSKSVHGRQVT